MTRCAPQAKPKQKERPKNPYFRSGITGGLNVAKMDTPESKFFDMTLDRHLRKVWLEVYVEVIKTKPRNEARMIADEALEDYLEKFSG